MFANEVRLINSSTLAPNTINASSGRVISGPRIPSNKMTPNANEKLTG